MGTLLRFRIVKGVVRFHRRKSLRTALLLYVLLPMGVVTAGGTWWGMRAFERQVERQMRRDLELVARAIERPLSHAMLREREGGIAEALKSAFELSEVYGAYLYDRDGNRISDTEPDMGAMERDEATEHVAAGEEHGEHGEFGEPGGRAVYSHFVPLADSGGQMTGLLQLTRRRSDFDENIRAMRLRVMGVFLFGFGGLTCLILIGHHRAFGKHMGEFTRSMTRIAEGDRHHRHLPRGSRELIALGTHFNKMLDNMRIAEEEIVRRRESERSLEERLRHAEKLAAVGELAAGIAHELGTPLSVVDARMQRVLREDGLSDRHRRGLEEVREETRRMEHIIRQLLDFSRRNTLHRRRMECGRMVRGAVSAVSRDAEEAGVSVEVGEDGGERRLEVDPVRIEQALVNLLRNGIQAAPGGRVEISVRFEAASEDAGVERAVFAVVDDGPGVPSEVVPKLFEPFFTTKAVGEGTGLGLSVVHGIAEEHGGRVEVDPNRASGACFRLFIPCDGDEGGEA